ncbi:MAG: hypothetical protein F4X96_08655 [Gammaproteobacteria bacterium]|nr:hypothetical protein [Chromatiales bacterium]MYE49489.1 hypothetical protein [Gammaproteobacteria bacterium]MYI37231.1 hypothetical protein [Acidimicrobiaceae bacterium]
MAGKSKNPLSGVFDRASAAGAPGRPERSGKKGVVIYLDPDMHRELKMAAVREDTTLQQLGVEALAALLEERRQMAALQEDT